MRRKNALKALSTRRSSCLEARKKLAESDPDLALYLEGPADRCIQSATLEFQSLYGKGLVIEAISTRELTEAEIEALKFDVSIHNHEGRIPFLKL